MYKFRFFQIVFHGFFFSLTVFRSLFRIEKRSKIFTQHTKYQFFLKYKHR